jgi:biopolymer transport protein ExbB/TolQ
MKRFLLVLGIVVGCLLTAGPMWGMLGTVIAMMRAFAVLEGPGISDPKALSGAIGTTLHVTAAGFVACPIGVVLLVVCIALLIKSNKPPQQPFPPPPDSPS